VGPWHGAHAWAHQRTCRRLRGTWLCCCVGYASAVLMLLGEEEDAKGVGGVETKSRCDCLWSVRLSYAIPQTMPVWTTTRTFSDVGTHWTRNLNMSGPPRAPPKAHLNHATIHSTRNGRPPPSSSSSGRRGREGHYPSARRVGRGTLSECVPICHFLFFSVRTPTGPEIADGVELVWHGCLA
jgi:hypothetical protein